MMEKLRIFVSSVQKELESERLIIQSLVNTDPFLFAHCTPLLYEAEPAAFERAGEGCLKALEACQVYLLIIGSEYGKPVEGMSITHREYRLARELGISTLIFIKGDRRMKREQGTATLLAEIDADGLKYKRFSDIVALQKEVRAALVPLLAEGFGIAPTSEENETAERQIEATSLFESQRLERLRWKALNHDLARRLIGTTEGRTPDDIVDADLLAAAHGRGFVWHDEASREDYATAVGILLLANDPSVVFPQSRILADSYRGTEPDGDPRDHEDICAPMPISIERALAFIDRNTRHPMRIVGLNRVRVDEYPPEALREGLVNAVAHRQYEDAGRKILLEVFSNRVVVASPGMPPAPITLASLRRGKYRPCSRNPMLAQGLSSFHRIEERGSGFRRMRDQMLDHGLDQPLIGANTGYFEITFPGPGENIDRIRVPEARLLVTPAVEAQFNERQRRIVRQVVEAGNVTSGWCLKEFSVVYNTAYLDLIGLVHLGVLKREGKGRGTRYTLEEPRP